MNQRDNILNELRELSPAVAGINRVNVFTVPDGYFESLTGILLIRASADDHLKGAIPTVPEGYFENLADNILNRIKKEVPQETEVTSELLAGISRRNIYTLPAGYFEALPAQILARIKTSDSSVSAETASISSLVAGIGKQNVYSLPKGYFSNLSADLLKQLRAGTELNKETTEISELVAGIGKHNIYKVPQGYFENLPAEILQRVTTTAKVISMKPRFSAFKYAAAAVVTGIIAISAFFMLNNNNDAQGNAQVALMAEANKIIETNSFDKEMNSISDAAIVAFLENKGQNVEASLVASLVDDKDLPDADEYLLNANTLDEMLKTLDLNN